MKKILPILLTAIFYINVNAQTLTNHRITIVLSDSTSNALNYKNEVSHTFLATTTPDTASTYIWKCSSPSYNIVSNQLFSSPSFLDTISVKFSHVGTYTITAIRLRSKIVIDTTKYVVAVVKVANLSKAPNIINGSNFIPMGSAFSISPIDSKISLKLSKSAPDTIKNGLTVAGFFQGDVKALNGATTLVSSNNPSIDFSATGGITLISSDLMWLNIIGNWQRSNYNLFNLNGTYGDILSKRISNTGSIILSSNANPEVLDRRVFFSYGIGYAWLDNYSTLHQMTLNENVITKSNAGGVTQNVITSTSGAAGQLVFSHYVTAVLEEYIRLTNSNAKNELYIGFKEIAYYATLTSKALSIEYTGGVYINFRKGSGGSANNIVNNKPKFEDVGGISITFQKTSINNLYSGNNQPWSIVLAGSIPLKFSAIAGKKRK